MSPLTLDDDALATLLIDAAWVSLATHVVGNRPGRIEPLAEKRHPKPRDLLTKPLDQARAERLARDDRRKFLSIKRQSDCILTPFPFRNSN